MSWNLILELGNLLNVNAKWNVIIPEFYKKPPCKSTKEWQDHAFSSACLSPTQPVRALKPRPTVMWQCLYHAAPAALRHSWAARLFIRSLLKVSHVQTIAHTRHPHVRSVGWMVIEKKNTRLAAVCCSYGSVHLSYLRGEDPLVIE